MDYNSLMEEARAKQEEKTRKLAKMREQQKRSEIEQQRKVQEKQKQAQINRIKQETNKLQTINRNKQSEPQIKQKTKPLEKKSKITKTADSVVNTAPITNNLKPKIKPLNNIPKTTTTTTTQPSQIHTNEVVSNKVSSEPMKKPPPPNYKELMELAKKNLEGNTRPTQTNNKFKNTPIPKLPKGKAEEKTAIQGENEKRKLTEDSSTKTQTQIKKQKIKDTPIDKKKTKIEPKEEPKPRRQIEQSDFFKKTFDKSPVVNKPISSTNRLKPKQTTSRPEEQTSEDDDGFIVSDDDNPGFNVSAFIQNMFRYNKSKYADEDAGAADESMVSNFTQQQYEERRSARIGKLEDLEDMRREEEMIEKLAVKKKKNKSLKRLQ